MVFGPFYGESFMYRIVRLSMTSTTFLVLGGAFAASAAQTPLQTSTARSAVDSVAGQLAGLELQRLRVAMTRDSTSIRDVDSRIQGLRQRLQSLRPDGSGRQVAADSVLLALDARQASVASNLSAARMVYTEAYPPVRQFIEEIRLIEERRNEIKAGRL
jgi:hypothetical protein